METPSVPFMRGKTSAAVPLYWRPVVQRVTVSAGSVVVGVQGVLAQNFVSTQ